MQTGLNFKIFTTLHNTDHVNKLVKNVWLLTQHHQNYSTLVHLMNPPPVFPQATASELVNLAVCPTQNVLPYWTRCDLKQHNLSHSLKSESDRRVRFSTTYSAHKIEYKFNIKQCFLLRYIFYPNYWPQSIASVAKFSSARCCAVWIIFMIAIPLLSLTPLAANNPQYWHKWGKVVQFDTSRGQFEKCPKLALQKG